MRGGGAQSISKLLRGEGGAWPLLPPSPVPTPMDYIQF